MRDDVTVLLNYQYRNFLGDLDTNDVAAILTTVKAGVENDKVNIEAEFKLTMDDTIATLTDSFYTYSGDHEDVEELEEYAAKYKRLAEAIMRYSEKLSEAAEVLSKR